VSDQDQLQWEARFGRPAAVAAFVAGVLVLAGTFVSFSGYKDRPGIARVPDSLLSVSDHPGTWIAASVLQALSALCLIAVFYYLFRATAHRLPQFPRWFLYIVLIGPVLYAVSQVAGSIDRADVAQRTADRVLDEVVRWRGQAVSRWASAVTTAEWRARQEETQAELVRLQAEHHELSQQHHATAQEIHALYTSTSWRITKPMRYLVTKLTRRGG